MADVVSLKKTEYSDLIDALNFAELVCQVSQVLGMHVENIIDDVRGSINAKSVCNLSDDLEARTGWNSAT